jgi:tetratricopeptide (TPR) repeat protein
MRGDRLMDAMPSGLRALRWPVKALALAAALLLAWRFGPPALHAHAAPPRPQQTVAFYEQELLDLRVLCPPEQSAWLAWRLAPHVRFAVDARGRAPKAVQASMGRALQADEGWKEALEAQGVEACWLPLGSPLAVALATAQAWQAVAVDDASVLYVKALPQMQELIRVYAPRGLRLGDPERPFDPSRLAQAEADLEMRLNRDPALGVLYLFQAELWLAKGNDAKARQTLEAGIRADKGFARNYARLAALRAARGETAEARLLYQKALRLRDEPRWRQALAALGER